MLCQSGGSAAGDGRALRRFLIVDALDPVRLSLSRLIGCRPEWQVVGDASARSTDCGSRERAARTQRSSTFASARSTFQDDALSISRFLAAGGHAFISKYEPPEARIDAIEQALAGRIRVAYFDKPTHDEPRQQSQSSA